MCQGSKNARGPMQFSPWFHTCTDGPRLFQPTERFRTGHLAFVPTSDPPGDYLPSEFGQSWDWFKDKCIGNTNPI